MHSSDERALWLARHVLPHEPALRAWLGKRLIIGIDIDDIVQETYARLSTLAEIEGIHSPRAYMMKTAHSVMISTLRKSQVISIRSFALFEEETFADDSPDPETIAMDRDELFRLGQAIADLPPRVREAFVLRKVEGLSQREVAQRLGLSESTVEKHIANGLRRIAAFFSRGGKRRHLASRNDAIGKEGAHGARDQRRD